MNSKEFIEAIRAGTKQPEVLNSLTRLNNHSVADLVNEQQAQEPHRAGSRPHHLPRSYLSDIIHNFHTRSGTLTNAVSKELSAFEAGGPILRVAHQPNFLPYRGLIAQFVLLDTAAKELRAQNTEGVTQVYFVVDHDTCRNYRFRTAHFPDPMKNQGVAALTLTEMVDTMDAVMTGVHSPSSQSIDQWADTLGDHATVHNSKLPSSHPLGVHPETLKQRQEKLRTLLHTAQDSARNLAEFNAMVLSRIVNGWWDLPTLFLPLSHCRHLLRPHYLYLLQHWREIRNAATATIHKFEDAGVEFSDNLTSRLEKVPFWYICPTCHSRNPVTEKGDSLVIEADCCGCDVHHSKSFGTWTAPELTDNLNQITPRTILDDLLDIIGFGIKGGVGYQSSLEHAILAHGIAKQMRWTQPPELYWRPYGYDLTPTEVIADQELLDQTRPHVKNPERALKTVYTGRATIGYNILFNGTQSLRNRLQTHFGSDTTVNRPLAPRTQLR